jgi:hypothetical protein
MAKQRFAYDRNVEPVVTSKVTLDILLKQENPGDLIALYTFYYYTAKWQDTTKAKATTAYTAKGLQWSEPRVRRSKKKLIELQLVEDVRITDSKTGKVKGYYVQVKFIWTLAEAHPVDLRGSGSCEGLVNRETNALQTINLNALRTKNKKRKEKNTKKKITKSPSKYYKLSKKLSEIVQTKKNVKHTTSQLTAWTKEFQKLKEQNDVSIKRQNAALDWYAKSKKDKYSLVIESGSTFREKFIRLESAMERASLPDSNTPNLTSGYRRKDGHKYKDFDVEM